MDKNALFALINRIKPALAGPQPVYLVGGAVRDMMLQRPIKDLDFAVSDGGIATARKVADLLKTDFFPLDRERDTGRVLFNKPGEMRIVMDFAAFRGPDLDSDLAARDFTVNALAMDIESMDRVIDPLGGMEDLYHRRVQACSPGSFINDPLRTLRALRQAAAFGFQIMPETRRLLAEAVPFLSRPSPERRRDELFNLLGGTQTATLVRSLGRLGMLPHLMPELEALQGVDQSFPHVHDVWEHTLAVVRELGTLLGFIAASAPEKDQAASLWMGMLSHRLGRYRDELRAHLAAEVIQDRAWRAGLFLAALYHDAGKPAAQSVEDGKIRFIGHEHVGANLVQRRARGLKLSNQEARRLKAIVKHHMHPHHLVSSGGQPSRRAVYRFFRDTGLAGVDICLLNLADVLGTYGHTLKQETWEAHLGVNRILMENWFEKPGESIAPPALLTGADLISEFGLAPGPQIGELLESLRAAQAEGKIKDERAALKWISQKIQ